MAATAAPIVSSRNLGLTPMKNITRKLSSPKSSTVEALFGSTKRQVTPIGSSSLRQ